MIGKQIKNFLFCSILIILFFSIISVTHADLIDDLKSKINERNKVIADLEKEIQIYQSQVEKTSVQAKSLKSDINALELTRKKLNAEVSVIQNKISNANLSIQKLEIQIGESEETISKNLTSISSILRQTNEEETGSLVETLLNYKSISSFLDRVEKLRELNESVQTRLNEVRQMKADLDNRKLEMLDTKKELVSLATNLSDKKKVVEYNKAETNKLLTQTKNQQSNYQKILNEKIALKNAFAQELLDFESQLKIAIDPSSLPTTGSGVLKWPVDKVKVTQDFGDTDFAKDHSQAYNGRGHNGIDLRAAIGTPIKAALSGKVVGTGNTDSVCPGASYGKWVLIEHDNGLSTLYAHLSVISVANGASVETGAIIGYSGETGYATGPHLHFTVYATQGVKVMTRKSTVCKGSYTMPVGSLNSYLNPLSYL